MTAVFENVERQMVADFKTIKARSNKFRCLYLKNKSYIEKDKLVEVVEDTLKSKHSSFYFCHKGVFILSPIINFEEVIKITRRISHETKLSENKIGEAFTLLKLDEDWDMVLNLIQKESDEQDMFLESNRAEQRQRLKNKIRENILKKTVNKNALPDFDAIRQLRRERVVLIVEDDRFTANLLQSNIGNGFNCVIAGTGEEAIDSYIAESPNIVFLDIELPDMNGYEVLDILKSMDPNLYVIVLTGHGTSENVLKAVDQEVKGFINKPFSREQVLKHINTIVEMYNEDSDIDFSLLLSREDEVT